MTRNFNPRSLTGATLYSFSIWYNIDISIHAPSRERLFVFLVTVQACTDFNPRSLTGATLIGVCSKGIPLNFNPRSLTGATQHRYQWAMDDMQFQSTLPHGSDGQGDRVIILHKYFNPRSLTGATDSCYFTWYNIYNFNPRSLTGATAVTPFGIVYTSISIHAPSRERRYSGSRRE